MCGLGENEVVRKITGREGWPGGQWEAAARRMKKNKVWCPANQIKGMVYETGNVLGARIVCCSLMCHLYLSWYVTLQGYITNICQMNDLI